MRAATTWQAAPPAGCATGRSETTDAEGGKTASGVSRHSAEKQDEHPIDMARYGCRDRRAGRAGGGHLGRSAARDMTRGSPDARLPVGAERLRVRRRLQLRCQRGGPWQAGLQTTRRRRPAAGSWPRTSSPSTPSARGSPRDSTFSKQRPYQALSCLIDTSKEYVSSIDVGRDEMPWRARLLRYRRRHPGDGEER